MATLSVTNVFIPGTPAESAEVNQNFQNIITWSQGNIQEDNLGSFAGELSWTITTGVVAISVANSGDQGSIELNQNAALNPNRSGIKLSHTTAEVSGDAGIFIDFSNASSSIPAVKASHSGSGASVQADQSGTGNNFVAVNTGSGKYFSGNDGVNEEFSVNGVEMLFSPGNSQELKVTSSGVQIGDGAGPVLSQDGVSNDLALDGDNLKINDATITRSSANTVTVDKRLTLEGDRVTITDISLIREDNNTLNVGAGDLRFNSNARLRDAGNHAIELASDSGVVRGGLLLNSSGRKVVASGAITYNGSTTTGVSFGYTFSSPPVVVVSVDSFPVIVAVSPSSITTTTFSIAKNNAGTHTVYWIAMGTYI